MIIPKADYKGRITEVEFNGVVKVGGWKSFNFYLFESDISNPPLFALEIYDTIPGDWSRWCEEVWSDVFSDPIAWVKKAESFSPDLLCLQLISTDPTLEDRSEEEASLLVKEVLKVCSLPIIIYGSGNAEKDIKVLKKIALDIQDRKLLLAPIKEENYRQIAAAALASKHKIVAQTPLDVNLVKQLNILLENLGLSLGDVIIDPTTGGLGYGLEYTYSVIERIRQAALIGGDGKLQSPIICNLGKEVWRVKEVKEEDESLGDGRKRGIMWEAISGISLLLAGADILIMRHPESMRLCREIVKELMM